MNNQPIPVVTADQMRIVDELAVNNYQIQLLQMMENAGRNLAQLARRQLLEGSLSSQNILVLAGSGGNGGGGMVAARRLHNWGGHVTVQCATGTDRLAPVTKHQMQGLLAAGVPVIAAGDPVGFAPDLIIDGLLGYSVKGAPRPPMDSLIEKANLSSAPILALDLPTGLDPDNGQPQEPTIRATMTMTLALPKAGLMEPAARDNVGQLWLADISLPAALYREMGLTVPKDLFAQNDIIRIHS